MVLGTLLFCQVYFRMASLSRGPLSKGVCYAYKNGDCKKGDKCNFIHEMKGMDADRPQTYEELVSIRRSKLSFVTTSVMSASADGKGYDQETAVAPKAGEDDTVHDFRSIDEKKLDERA